LIHLDTHVLIWLAERRTSRLSSVAQRIVERESLAVSPIVVLELETLRERGKLKNEPARLLAVVNRDFGLTRSQARLDAIVEAACPLAWTRDPFDRLIVANAIADGARLITADETILANFEGAVW
jgi:PIN domain nuclease of toxin-antitoxin system